MVLKRFQTSRIPKPRKPSTAAHKTSREVFAFEDRKQTKTKTKALIKLARV